MGSGSMTLSLSPSQAPGGEVAASQGVASSSSCSFTISFKCLGFQHPLIYILSASLFPSLHTGCLQTVSDQAPPPEGSSPSPPMDLPPWEASQTLPTITDLFCLGMWSFMPLPSPRHSPRAWRLAHSRCSVDICCQKIVTETRENTDLPRGGSDRWHQMDESIPPSLLPAGFIPTRRACSSFARTLNLGQPSPLAGLFGAHS